MENLIELDPILFEEIHYLSPQEREEFEETWKIVEGLAKFEPEKLVRRAELGDAFNFAAILPQAKRIVNLYKMVSRKSLVLLPTSNLQRIRNQSGSVQSYFHQILSFDPSQGNSAQHRSNIIKQAPQQYEDCFAQLSVYVALTSQDRLGIESYLSSNKQELETLKVKLAADMAALDSAKIDAERIVKEIQNVAAETGVSKQAEYFKAEAAEHGRQATIWEKETRKVALLLACIAVLSFFVHKLEFLRPSNPYETVQLAISKFLIFAVVSYWLYISARNFLSHKHGEIVNKHRQNALMTYTTIVEAAGNTPNREVILNHAAACIFSPQTTGYVGDTEAPATSAGSIVKIFAEAK